MTTLLTILAAEPQPSTGTLETPSWTLSWDSSAGQTETGVRWLQFSRGAGARPRVHVELGLQAGARARFVADAPDAAWLAGLPVLEVPGESVVLEALLSLVDAARLEGATVRHAPAPDMSASSSQAGLGDPTTWVVVERDGMCGFATPDGSVRMAPRFEAARPFVEDRAAVRLGGRWGFIDEHGSMIIEPRYDEVGDFFAGGQWAPVRQGELWGLVDRLDTAPLEPHYEALGQPGAGMLAVRRAQRWGYVDLGTGRERIAPRFDDVGQFSGDAAAVKIGARWMSIDTHGHVRHTAAAAALSEASGHWQRARRELIRGAVVLLGFHLALLVALPAGHALWSELMVSSLGLNLTVWGGLISWFLTVLYIVARQRRLLLPRYRSLFWCGVSLFYAGMLGWIFATLSPGVVEVLVKTRLLPFGEPVPYSAVVHNAGPAFFLAASVTAPTCWAVFVLIPLALASNDRAR